MGLRAQAKIHGLLRVANTLHFKFIEVATIRASHKLIVLAIENTGFCLNILVEIVIWVVWLCSVFLPQASREKRESPSYQGGNEDLSFSCNHKATTDASRA